MTKEKDEETKSVHLMTAPSGIFNESNFHVYYKSIALFHESDKKMFFGKKSICRYCGETNPKKFKNVAHACPEFTGNKLFFSNDECEACNNIFSKYETELSNHSHFMRTLLGVRGKNKSLSFKSNNKAISFCHDAKGILCHVNNDILKDPNSEPQEGFTRKKDSKKRDQEFTFKFKKKRYVPLFLFKALNKVAFSIMPQLELDSGGFERFAQWLRIPEQTFSEEEPHQPYFYIYHNQVSLITKKPILMLFKKRDDYIKDSLPTFSNLFIFGNFAYQIFIPFYKSDEQFLYANELFLPIIPEIMTKREDKDGFIWMNGISREKTELEDFHFVLKTEHSTK